MKLFYVLASMLIATAASAQSRMEVVCSYAPSQSKVVAAISGAAGGASATASAVATAAGLTAVSHSSGAVILTGSAGYVAGTLGGASAVPVIVATGLVVGGVAVTVELVCAGKNHPEQVAKVQAAAEEFSHRFSDTMRSTKIAAANMAKSVGPAAGKATVQVKRVTGDVWQYVYSKSSEVSKVLAN
jgi:hypothetical protein